ncbi:MAG: transposase [Peptoniphilaceae bacterium]
MPISAKQINLCDISSDFDEFYYQNQENLLSLIDKFININEFIPESFYDDYYLNFGRPRDYSLESMLLTFLLKDLFSLPSIRVMIVLLNNSKDLREFLGFLKIPNESQFSRFKLKFLDNLGDLFHNLVDATEDMANEINPFLSSILITDTTGFEPYVTENNPKFFQQKLKKAKAYAKKTNQDNSNSSFDIQKYAQGQMPKYSSSNPDAKLSFHNGHFGYFQKAVISTNGFGLVRDINFYDSNNKLSVDLTPKEIKEQYDAKSLIPTLETFFTLHPDFSYKYFLGDAGFDADDNYTYLHRKKIMPIISLNSRNTKNLPESGLNEFGVPYCPYDNSLPMIYDGITREKGRADRIKYICPKAKKTKINGKTTYLLNCNNPCTDSKSGRIKNLTVNHNYRFNTSMPRDSLKWISLFKIRTRIERTIAQLKNFIQINSLKVRNTKSLKSEIILACITQMIAFILLYKVSDNHSNPLAIKSLIA